MQILRSLTVLCLALTVAPAYAQIIYSNGPVNGNVAAWQINDGKIISDSFSCCRYSSNGPNGGIAAVAGFDFYVWAFPGDTPLTVDWSITSGENGGTVLGFGTANLSSQFLFTNAFGFDIDKETASGLNLPVALGSGTYWLNLQNATTQQGNPLSWDQNSGPSQASSNEVGTIPSESFDIFGPGGSTPEPGSIVLLGSGMLVLAQARRLKSKFWSNSRIN